MSEELSAQHLILEELKAINAEQRSLRKDMVDQTNDIRKDLVNQTRDLRRELTEELTIQTQDIRTTIAAVLEQMSKDKVHNEARFTELETHIYSLLGNGQPGRVGKLETAVADLKKTVNTWGGAIAVIGSVITIGLAILSFAAKHP